MRPLDYAKTATIYGICDPRDNSLRYVGCTTRRLIDRLYSHYYEADNGSWRTTAGQTNSHKTKNGWLNELMSLGLTAQIFEIESVPFRNRLKEESFWISYFHSVGCDLFNQRGIPGRYPYRN